MIFNGRNCDRFFYFVDPALKIYILQQQEPLSFMFEYDRLFAC